MKKGLTIITSLLLACTLLVPTSYAEETSNTISLTDLKENIDYLFPNSDYISGLAAHSTWEEVSRENLSEVGGIEVTYQAIYDASPSASDELPTINMYLIPAVTQTAAELQFNTWSNSLNFTYGTWKKLTEGSDYFSYYTESTTGSDLIKYRHLEEGSLHLVGYYDNILMIANFYRTSGEYLRDNVSAYLDYLDDYEDTLSVMNELFVYSEEALKFYLGSIFSVEGPSDYDYHPDSATYSLDLSEIYSIPQNGTLSFDVYIDDGSEIGTILDMSGLDEPEEGAFSAGINENAVLEISFYASDTPSDCQDEYGWHHLYTAEPLDLYDWQDVQIGYGEDQGLNLWVNQEQQDQCEVYIERAAGPIYLGDYPGDTFDESFVGYVKGVVGQFSVDSEGNILDDLSESLIFADVSEAHRYAEAIAYLKEEGIIEGYANGTFRPEQSINRVEILKMLLLGFDYEVSEDFTMLDFSDLDDEAWYLPYLNYAVNLGIVQGHPNGTYLPSHSLNRAEFLKILFNTYGIILTDYPITDLYPDTGIDAWYATYVQYAKDNNLMDTDLEGNFNPGNEVTRGEVGETIYRLIAQY